MQLRHWRTGATTPRGGVITLEYPDYYVVTCYTPNAQEGLKRIDHRMAWEDDVPGISWEAGIRKSR